MPDNVVNDALDTHCKMLIDVSKRAVWDSKFWKLTDPANAVRKHDKI